VTTLVDPVPLIAALNERQIPYVIIGGFAVIANGYVRSTEDLDVLVPATRDTADAVRQLCADLGATDIHSEAIPTGRFDGENHIRAHTPHGILDFVPEGESPFTYEEIAHGSFEVEFEGNRARIAGLAHLVALKRLAGRTRDQADLEALEQGHGELPELDG
jgi:predicted nucleotidyltransferase